jgi:hypothetical protein
VLLNRVGRDTNRFWGYGDAGFDVTLDDQAANGDIHAYRLTLNGNHNTAITTNVTGRWAPDGRTNDPNAVVADDARPALLSGFKGISPNGTWTLFLADLDAGQDSTLVSWGLEINGVLYEPTIVAQPQNQQVAVGNTAQFSVTAAGTASLSYQWFKNGSAILNATNLAFSLQPSALSDAGAYSAMIFNAAGAVTSLVANLLVGTFAEALENSNAVWSTSGDTHWIVQTNITHDGVDAARSGVISGGQQSVLTAAVQGPAVVAFWWKVSSATNSAWLRLANNGVVQTNISGTVDWQRVNLLVGAGNHLLSWSYTNAGVSIGQSAAWLDQVECHRVQAVPQELAPASNTFRLFTPTITGRSYTLEFKNNLTDADWQVLTTINGTDGDSVLMDTNAIGTNKFYRIRVQ